MFKNLFGKNEDREPQPPESPKISRDSPITTIAAMLLPSIAVLTVPVGGVVGATLGGFGVISSSVFMGALVGAAGGLAVPVAIAGMVIAGAATMTKVKEAVYNFRYKRYEKAVLKQGKPPMPRQEGATRWFKALEDVGVYVQRSDGFNRHAKQGRSSTPNRTSAKKDTPPQP